MARLRHTGKTSITHTVRAVSTRESGSRGRTRHSPLQVSVDFIHTYDVFTMPDFYFCADADTENCTEKVTVDVDRIALRLVLNRYGNHLSWCGSQSRSSENTSEYYH